MATASTSSPLSRYSFSSSLSSHSSTEDRTTIPRTRSITHHYRTVSRLLSEELEESLSPDSSRSHFAKSRRSSSAQLFMSFNNYPLLVHKPKDKSREKEARIRKISSIASIGLAGRSSGEKDRPVHPRRGIANKNSLDSYDDVIDISPQNKQDDIIISRENAYEKRNFWYRRDKMRMHPYPDDAIYMQSYDPIILENEKYSYLLLRRLTSSIPTFSRSMDKPPSAVLDLGCGQGHWLLDASTTWTSAEFTGFDLVDVLLPEVRRKANICLVRGNFIKYPLPFPDQTFDFVRMANLSLAIPHDKWNFVLFEVRRVLKTGGELELIDDQLLFPYGQIPASPSSHWPNSHISSKGMVDISDGGDSDTSLSTLCVSDITDSTLADESAITVKSEAADPTPMATRGHSITYAEQWASNRQVSLDVEHTFINMLRRLSVHPYPKEFVPDLLRYTFGGGNVSNPQTYNIRLASSSPSQSHRAVPQKDISPNSPVRNSDQEAMGPAEENGNSPTRSAFSLVQSAKAAGRLGISYSDLVVATAASRRHPDDPSVSPNHYTPTLVTRRGGSSQPQGIMVSPSTFIPLTPIETEFHACKWIHTLLGCKPAITRHVRKFVDRDGRRVVGEAELSDALWTYESFRRQRFHWPADPEPDHESFVSPCISDTHRLDSRQVTGSRRELVHIRTIQVYHATKTEMTSLASLLFSPNTTSSPPSSH